MFMQGHEEITQDHKDARFVLYEHASTCALHKPGRMGEQTEWVELFSCHPFDFIEGNEEGLTEDDTKKLEALREGEFAEFDFGTSGRYRVLFANRDA